MNMYICDFVEVCAHVISLGGLLDAKVSCGRLIFLQEILMKVSEEKIQEHLS